MSDIKTINLTGEEKEVEFESSFMCFRVKNIGSEVIYASGKPGIVPDADGVIYVSAGSSIIISSPDITGTKINKLYLSGNGNVQIWGMNSLHSPFDQPADGAGKSDGFISTYGFFGKTSGNCIYGKLYDIKEEL